MTYASTCCEKMHEDRPDLTFDRSAFAAEIPEEKFFYRIQPDADSCIVDDKHYFICGVLLVPIHESHQDLGFGVCVLQKRENSYTYVENFDSADIGPFFGWVSNEFMYGGKSTVCLKTMAHFQGNGLRPLIELEETDHPLSIAQRRGIGFWDAWTFAHRYFD